MAWLAPKTNWMISDGVADVDFNRIEGNILDLKNNTVPLAGGVTMTGLFTLSGDPTAALHPGSKQYIDAQVAVAKSYAP